MAKIQYIKAPQIEFDTPSSGYNYRQAPTPKKTDPALMLFAGLGIFGILLAVVAMIITIVSLQSKKEVSAVMSEAFTARIKDSSTYLSKYLTANALVMYSDAMNSMVEEYKTGKITERKLNQLITNAWTDILEKEPSKALLSVLMSDLERNVTSKSEKISKALAFFTESPDSDILLVSSGQGPSAFSNFAGAPESDNATASPFSE